MKITLSETLVYIDVDQTLLMWDKPEVPGENKIAMNYYGKTVFLTPHRPNIDLLKSWWGREYYVIVHSANGPVWAASAIKALDLEAFVEEAKAKPIKYLDDKPSQDWMGAHVYLPEDLYDS